MTDHTTNEATNEIPYGYCHCGCGQKTRVAPRTASHAGWIKGQPLRYINHHHSRQEVNKRFWDKVDKRGPDECWEWNGAKCSSGYGIIRIENRALSAHRVSYEIHYGPIPDGMHVLHICDRPPCCNPAHFFLGTHQDNMDDRVKKNRSNRKVKIGEDAGSAKLTEAQVREIRQLRATGMTQRDVADRFGISQPNVWKIVHRKAWQHIT